MTDHTPRPSIARRRRRIVLATTIGAAATFALAVPAFARDGADDPVGELSATTDASTVVSDDTVVSTPDTTDDTTVVSTPDTDATTADTTDDTTKNTSFGDRGDDDTTNTSFDRTTDTSFDDHGGDRDAVALAPFTRSWTLNGRTVTVTWTGRELLAASLDGATPIDLDGDPERIKIADGDARLEVRVDDGRLRVELRAD